MTGTGPETYQHSVAQRRGPSFATILIGIALLTVGVIWLLDVSGAYSVSWFAVAAIALVVVGLALMVGSFSGGHGGLITIGIILTALLTVATWTDTRFEGGVGERNYTPVTFEDLNDSYRLAAGPLEIDLRQIDFPPGETTLEVRVGAGQAIIIVPDGIAVAVDWRVVAGNVDIFGNEQSGVILEDFTATQGFDEADQRLLLDVIVTTGSIEVRR